MSDAATLLRSAADALEREERTEWDICTCQHERQTHLGRKVGCMGGYDECGCRRFTLERFARLGFHTSLGLIQAMRHRADLLVEVSG